MKIKFLPVQQPIGKFLSTVIKSETLYSLATSDVLKIVEENSNTTIPYLGKQRELNTKKIKNIEQYLKTRDATFPNSIIVHLNKDKLIGNIDWNNNTLEVREDRDVFSILDGQHRLEGLHRAGKNIDVVVSILLDLSEAQQIEVFDTINSEQTKVNGSAITYKQALSEYETPRKFASRLAISFATDSTSIWKNKIKLIGTKDIYSEEGTISLLAFYRRIVELIYNDDSDYYNLRAELEKNNNRPDLLEISYDDSKYIFWNFYKENQLTTVFKILNNYFSAIRSVLPNEFSNPNSLIQKTTGYNAIMFLFQDLYSIGYKNGDLSNTFFLNKLKNLSSLDGTINTNNYPGSGDSSANKLYKILKDIISL
ncbi:TPA: DGQHR domain-containing protein [Streptococcus suis]